MEKKLCETLCNLRVSLCEILFHTEEHSGTRSFTEKNVFLFGNAIIGLALMSAFWLVPDSSARKPRPEEAKAAEHMAQSLACIQQYCAENRINAGNPEDTRHTGLIGPEWSEITTTIGDPAAKRTTVNPRFAALIAHLLLEAGVHPGDTIAVGSSGSFPALLIASLSAAKALNLHPLVIISLGSSSFGASNPDFTLWDMYRLLLAKGLIDVPPVAASLGGEDDTGAGFEPTVIARLTESIRQAGIPLINEKELAKNVSMRARLYRNARLFINSGGGVANIGTSAEVLRLHPGLVRHAAIPPPDRQGMIHLMLQKEIPVIHLLYIKGLAQRYGIPWDPASLNVPGKNDGAFPGRDGAVNIVLIILGMAWFTAFLLRFRMLNNSRRKPSEPYV